MCSSARCATITRPSPHDPGRGHVVAASVARGAGRGSSAWRPFLAEPYVRHGHRARSWVTHDRHARRASEDLARADPGALSCRLIAVLGGLGTVCSAYRPALRIWDDGAASRSQDDLRKGRHCRAPWPSSRRAIQPLHDGAFTRYGAIMVVTVIAVRACTPGIPVRSAR